MNLSAIMLLAFGQVADAPTTYKDVVETVHADLARMPVELRPFVRYLSLQGIPAKDREAETPVLNGHCNSLSSKTFPAPVDVIGGIVARVNLLHYGWQTSTWEKLSDPYYIEDRKHERTELVKWEGGEWPPLFMRKPGEAAKYYPYGAFTWHKPMRVTIKRALAPWVTDSDKPKALEILAWTQSQVPIVRWDWFLSQTAKQAGSDVGYYDFLGVKSQKDWETLIRFSAPLSFELEQRRVLSFSGISHQPRRVERTKTVLGGLWRTFDNELATGDRNPIRELDDLRFKFDATEQFAPLPNGLPAWLLADSTGKLQAFAPENIVKRNTHGGEDDKVHVYKACYNCHFKAKEENGIKDLNFLRFRELTDPDYKKFLELQRQYLRDLGPEIVSDRTGYAVKILEITGLEAGEYAKRLGAAVIRYDDAKVDLATLALWVGVPVEDLTKRLRVVDDAKKLDPLLSIVLDGGRIPIRQTEEVFPAAMAIIYGTK